MSNVFETSWLPKTLSKEDRLLVQPASKKRKAIWGHPKIPVWDEPTANINISPWWFVQKGDVLQVVRRPKSCHDNMWVEVSFGPSNDTIGWILAQHAYTCARYRKIKNVIEPAKLEKPPCTLSMLREGIVLEYKGLPAIVVSWSTRLLPLPHLQAKVLIEHKDSLKEVWLTSLQMP